MRILLFGAKGQVGWELQRSLAPLGNITACDCEEVDFNNLDGLRSMVRKINPEVIVNSAAYTAVDSAESNSEVAMRINCDAVGVLAEEAKKNNAWLVHYSTDYVFDGSQMGYYKETDSPNPLNVYGASKLAGDLTIIASRCRFLIFRTSWVFSARGLNFVRKVLELARENAVLNVVADQHGAPTSAELVADVTAFVLDQISRNPKMANSVSGIYNLVPGGETSWYEYGQFILRQAALCKMRLRAKPEDINPILTTEYHLPAKRPLNSRLDTNKFTSTFGYYLPKWEVNVGRTVAELSEVL